MTTNDVTIRYAHRHDVSDGDDGDWLASTAQTVPPADDPGCRLYSFVISSLLIGFLIVFGLIGNSTAFLVFQRDTLKTSTSFLFQGIAVVDNLLLVTTFPMYCINPVVKFFGLDSTGYQQYCEAFVIVFVMPLAFFAHSATVWSTTLIGVNRYVAVCHPYQASRLCTVRQARIQLATVISLAVLYNAPKFGEARVELEVDPADNSTWLVPVHTALGVSRLYNVAYGNVCYTLFLLVLPLVILAGLNVRLIREVKALGRRRLEMRRKNSRQAQDNNVTFVLIVVVLVFIICQTPALVTQILWSVLPDEQRLCGGVQFYFSQLTNLLVIANSSLNVVIYMTFNTRFRQVFRQTCVLGRSEAAAGSDGLSRLEVIEMEDRRQANSPGGQVPGRPASALAPPVASSKSQLIVHCDDWRHTASASCDSIMFDVV